MVFEIGNKKVTTKHIKGAGAGEAAWDDVSQIALVHSSSLATAMTARNRLLLVLFTLRLDLDADLRNHRHSSVFEHGAHYDCI